MCLIIQRAISHIPIIVMGESGVGKTALISFLVQVVFGHRILIFNIHAGIDE
jgi:midasin (ATPase involved in ribosome maturation)